MTNDIKHLFKTLFAICIIFFSEVSAQLFSHFIGFFGLLLSIEGFYFLHILNQNPLSEICLVNMLS